WHRKISPDICGLLRHYLSFAANSVSEPRLWTRLSVRKYFVWLCRRSWLAVIRFESDIPFRWPTPDQEDMAVQGRQPFPSPEPNSEVTFCVRGVITAPCGVPIFVSDHSPSSDTPALNHLPIRRSILGSAIRCWTNVSNHSWLR